MDRIVEFEYLRGLLEQMIASWNRIDSRRASVNLTSQNTLNELVKASILKCTLTVSAMELQVRTYHWMLVQNTDGARAR